MKDYIWEQTARVADIQLDWPNIEGLVVKAGTPVSMKGRVANDGTAIGILLDDAIFVNSPVVRNDPVPVLVGGVCELAGAEAESGITLEAEAINAMKDITFLSEDGGSTSPVFQPAENLADSEATTIAVLKSDFNSLLAKLKDAGLMVADEPEPEPEPGDGGADPEAGD